MGHFEASHPPTPTTPPMGWPPPPHPPTPNPIIIPCTPQILEYIDHGNSEGARLL